MENIAWLRNHFVIVAWWIGITFTLSPHEYAVVTTTTEILRFYHHLNVRGYNQV